MWKTRKTRQTSPELRNFAQECRKRLTPCEEILWRSLRCKRMCGVRFHRQKAIANYVVDFYCPKARLVVEVIGNHHRDQPGQAQRDVIHDACLASRGLMTLRFTNCEVYEKIGYVQAAIRETVMSRMQPNPNQQLHQHLSEQRYE